MPPSGDGLQERPGRRPPKFAFFCLTLSMSGGRISEILALTPAAIDLDSYVAVIRTLKRRKPGSIRQVPLPRGLINDLNRSFGIRQRQRDPLEATTRLWRWSRTTAWRRVKEVMALADVSRPAAMPKGCGTASVSMRQPAWCRSIWSSAGLGMHPRRARRFIAMSVGRTNALLPHACGAISRRENAQLRGHSDLVAQAAVRMTIRL